MRMCIFMCLRACARARVCVCAVNATLMILELADGTLISTDTLSAEQTVIKRANGAVRFVAGTAELSGEGAFMQANSMYGSDTIASRAQALCQALSCSLSE